MTDKIKEQILEIRDTGLINMMDAKAVKGLAIRFGMKELAEFLSNRKNYKRYGEFIMGR